MVDPVKIRRDQEKPEDAIQSAGKPDVRVIEHGGDQDQKIKNEYGREGKSQQKHG